MEHRKQYISLLGYYIIISFITYIAPVLLVSWHLTTPDGLDMYFTSGGDKKYKQNFGVEVFWKAITKKTKNLMMGQQDENGEIGCVNYRQMDLTRYHVHRQASALVMVHEENVFKYLYINSCPPKFTICKNIYLLKKYEKIQHFWLLLWFWVIFCRRRDTTATIVTRLQDGQSRVQIPAGVTHLFTNCPDWLWDPSSLLFNR